MNHRTLSSFSPRTLTTRRLALVGLVWVGACKGSGKPTLVLDEETVTARLTEIGAEVPGCDVTDGTAARLVGDSARRLRDVASTVRRVAEAAGPLMLTDSDTGACGGSMGVTSDHANGTTVYQLGFDQFCATSADGNVTLDGALIATQEGKPSDAGPVISALEVESDGALVIAQNGETAELTIESIRTEYGAPAAWTPGEPTADKPDVTTISRASVVFQSDGREEYVRDLVYTRAGLWDATYEITGGQLGREGEDFVTVRTVEGEPLVVNLLGLQLTSGAVELGGADGTFLQVRNDGVTPGVFALELNGSSFAKGLDCAAGREPLSQTAMALLQGLPVP